MRLRGPLLVALVLLAASPGWGDDDADRNAEVRASIALLASPDEAVRAEAAERIVGLGHGAVEEAARGSAGLDDAAWKTFADACVSGKGWASPLPFVAASGTAPEAHRKRLLALAARIDPKAGGERTRDEVAAIVREYLVDRVGERCSTGHDLAISRLGHAAVPEVFALLRGDERKHVASSTAYAALVPIVEREDVPVLRELLHDGRSGAAASLARLQQRGFPEAADALVEAVDAGRFDERIAKALVSSPDGARTVKAVRACLARRAAPSEEDRSQAAELFGKFGPAAAGETVPDLETWLAASQKPWAISSIATALVRLGSAKGVETLVRLVGEDDRGKKCGCKCCVGKPAPVVPPGSLCAEGFGIWERWPATKLLAEVAGRDVFVVATEDEIDAARDAARAAGREPESTEQLVARGAAAFHTWWAASKERLAFDPASGRWSVGK